jgi:hypothetical protein
VLTKEAAALMGAVATVVREYVGQVFDTVDDRLKALENKPTIQPRDGEPGKDGQPGRDGKDADESRISALEAEIVQLRAQMLESAQAPEPPDINALVKAAVAAEVALLPTPKDGAPGRSVELSDVEPLVKAAVDAIPRPQDGRSVTVDDVAPMITSEVAKAVSALPAPPEPVSVADALISRDGQLTVTFTDGTVKSVGVVVGRDADPEDVKRMVAEAVAEIPRPKDGAPGRDGSLENMRLEFDGLRTCRWVFKDGTPVEGGEIRLPSLLYQGLYDATKQYEVGDVTTWGGSMWVARVQTSGIDPDENSPAGKKTWALGVMRGRQGRQGLKGDTGGRGPQGEMGPQGRSGS